MDSDEKKLFDAMKSFIMQQLNEEQLPPDLQVKYSELCSQLRTINDENSDSMLSTNPHQNTSETDSLIQFSPNNFNANNLFFADNFQDSESDEQDEDTFREDLNAYENLEGTLRTMTISNNNQIDDEMYALTTPPTQSSPVLTTIDEQSSQQNSNNNNNNNKPIDLRLPPAPVMVSSSSSTTHPPDPKSCLWSGEVYLRLDRNNHKNQEKSIFSTSSISQSKWHLRAAYLTTKSIEIYKAISTTNKFLFHSSSTSSAAAAAGAATTSNNQSNSSSFITPSQRLSIVSNFVASCREKSLTGALMERAQQYQLTIPLSTIANICEKQNIGGKSRVIEILLKFQNTIYLFPRPTREFEVWFCRITEALNEWTIQHHSHHNDTFQPENCNNVDHLESDKLQSQVSLESTPRSSVSLSSILDWGTQFFATISNRRSSRNNFLQQISTIENNNYNLTTTITSSHENNSNNNNNNNDNNNTSSSSTTEHNSNNNSSKKSFLSFSKLRRLRSTSAVGQHNSAFRLWKADKKQNSRLPLFGGHKGTLVPVNPSEISMQGKLMVQSPTYNLETSRKNHGNNNLSSSNGPLSDRMPLSNWSWNIPLQRSSEPRFYRRFCLLSRGFFTVFDSAKSHGAYPQIQFPLSACSLTYDENDHLHERFRFVLLQGLRKLLILEASNQAEYGNWLNALIKATPRSDLPPHSLVDEDEDDILRSKELLSPIYETANRLVPRSLNTLEALRPGRTPFTLDWRSDYDLTKPQIRNSTLNRSLSTSMISSAAAAAHHNRREIRPKFRNGNRKVFHSMSDFASKSIKTVVPIEKSCPSLALPSSSSSSSFHHHHHHHPDNPIKSTRMPTLSRITSDPIHWLPLEEEDFPELPSRVRPDGEWSRLFQRKSSVISLSSWFNRSVISSPVLQPKRNKEKESNRDETTIAMASSHECVPKTITHYQHDTINEEFLMETPVHLPRPVPKPPNKLLESFRHFGDRFKGPLNKIRSPLTSRRNKHHNAKEEPEEETYASCAEIDPRQNGEIVVKETKVIPPSLPPRSFKYS